MSVLVPLTAEAVEQAVGSSSVAFGAMITTATLGQALYQLTADTSLWFSQGTTPTATVGNGSTYLAAGQAVTLDGSLGAQVAVLQSAAAGHASLTPLLAVR